MGRFLVQMFAALSLVVSGSLVAVAPAHAAPSTSVAQSTEVVKAAPNFSIPHVAPKSNSIPKVVGGGVIRPLYTWLPPQYCYWQSGITSYTYYCYRYGCTYFERVAWGCYNGYVRINTVYWA